ncbi:MAG: hypothetical protein ACR2MX_19285 [Cyclobacteriaceae bacterium]
MKDFTQIFDCSLETHLPKPEKVSNYVLMVILLLSGILVLTSIESIAASTDPGPNYKKLLKQRRKASKQKFTQRYLEIAGGYGIWSHTFQAGMASHQQPIDLSVSYGKAHQPFSFQIGTTVHTGFAQDIFVFRPKNVYAGIKLSLLKALGQDQKRMDPYMMAGVTGWEGVLTDQVYEGIVNYEKKKEKDRGIGAVVSIGALYHYKRFRFGPQFSYYLSGNGQYLAGGFEKQNINSSYMTIMVKAGYRIDLNGKGSPCPSYK